MTRMERQGANMASTAVAAVFVPLAALSAATSGPPQSQEAWAAQAVTWGWSPRRGYSPPPALEVGPQPLHRVQFRRVGGQPLEPQFDGGELPDRRWYLPPAGNRQPRKPVELGTAQLHPWGTRPRLLLSRR